MLPEKRCFAETGIFHHCDPINLIIHYSTLEREPCACVHCVCQCTEERQSGQVAIVALFFGGRGGAEGVID